MAETIQQLLRERIDDPTPAVKYADRVWTWREHLAEASTMAAALIGIADPQRPLHVGALLGNTPEMLTAMAAAALGGYVLCGINDTRRGAALANDILRADCQLLLIDPEHRDLLDGLELPGVQVFDTSSSNWSALLASAGPLQPHREVAPTDTFMMIFTSGTSGEPKAVQVMHLTVLFAGSTLIERFEITPDDVCYLSMPLFHSNALLAGWSVAVGSGAAMVPAKFSASRLLADLRRYGATFMNYVGKPLAYVLATPEQPDDRDNPLRVAFGNEASDRDIAEFSRRFDCTVWDGFGSTEGAIIITREDGCPPGSLGRGFPGVAIYNPQTGTECPPAVFDDDGALANPDEAIGELVNTSGAGLFAGYYNDPEATSARLRDGMFWSGDLAYRDEDGWIYFAGRSADWLRVDGENMTTAPIERILQRLPAINHVAVYAVPDERVGDQVMAAIVLQDNADLTPEEFGKFLAAQPDLSPKAWPRHVWLTDRLPTTATNKILKRELTARGARPDGGVLWTRAAPSNTYVVVDRNPKNQKVYEVSHG
ncbi:fatty-acid--CoA ligase FadD1 [Mycobacterium xenopi]|uniref:Acyl-CoA synthetase n=1 Tax=Mycobacterium xenopi TaxID=1789 RepID=A0AAD1M0W9_MYCXE|nr:fatty-acid--CoA ligase FadD1 [Mycobacterium xenopi]EID10854.1 acyl-CoA synthetase [Mycobacterium xenopi RIVM700367]MDA3641411.1 fatty-acid--CoA ligase FadD1 [Mycobacterium xenopi]MDA3659441.1 fatty-acid--CoA ligase FadD1 [Mycobacterium xenopi]MDA3664531.1 fatty-acid--CoA ligase FadD1 [Mycobacterium xenopi]ORX20445.1 acyl-CoA synthetase [Mycobacterium xenopi]